MGDPHLSIGEVLALLQGDFPDVTISKIRFLESQGLISPERTPSGYRKFYGPDIDRLRWILLQQRENFLPLKVIRERLEAEGPDMGAPVEAEPVPQPPPEPAPATTAADMAAGTVRASMPAGELDPPVPSRPQPIWMADVAANRGERTVRDAEALPLDDVDGADQLRLTAGELIEASGISAGDLADLEQFGLVTGRELGDDVFYDADALIIAKRSAAFFARGVGARHLRMYKVAAEREAGFLEQIVMPMLKRRNPQARTEAVDLLEELGDLGHDLRAALLRANLREHLGRT